MQETDREGWISVLPAADLPAGKPIRVDADGVGVLLYRHVDRILAVADRCTHQGAPLHKGSVRATDSLQRVACPLHGVFGLTDGRVMRGPATIPIQVYDARQIGEVVEVRPASR